MEESERILQPSTAVKPLRSRPYKVCIVGAGVAGLSAAEALVIGSRGGSLGDDDVAVEIKILEALDRPGGRAVTLPFAGGVIEGGAQFIHGCEGNAVYHRAKLHDLELSGHRGAHIPLTYSKLQPDGKQVPNSFVAEVNDLYSDIIVRSQVASYQEEREKSGEHTVGAFVKRYFERYYRAASGSPRDKRVKANLFRMRTIMECCYSACNNLHDLMLGDFGEYLELIGNVTFKKGYGEFVDTFLANLLPGTVEYNKPVQQIDWSCHGDGKMREDQPTNPVTITTVDGYHHQADYVIVTASLGYLKENARAMFSPALPQDKLDLVARMGFGTTAKVWLEYETPFWAENWGGLYAVWDESPSDIMKNKFKEKEWFKHIYGISRLHNSPRVLIVWFTGKAAEYVETLEDTHIADTLTGVLRQFLKNPNIPLPTNVLKTGWHSNPYVRGSYSYVAAGSEGADIDRLAEPVCIPGENGVQRPVICFAGEATHRTFYSTTHGALLSGQREAERILADIRLQVTTEAKSHASE